MKFDGSGCHHDGKLKEERNIRDPGTIGQAVFGAAATYLISFAGGLDDDDLPVPPGIHSWVIVRVRILSSTILAIVSCGAMIICMGKLDDRRSHESVTRQIDLDHGTPVNLEYRAVLLVECAVIGRCSNCNLVATFGLLSRSMVSKCFRETMPTIVLIRWWFVLCP